jgi:hypothetical protein
MTKEEFEKSLSVKTYYLTKHCLSKGIETASQLCESKGNVLVSYRRIRKYPFNSDWEYIPFMWRHKPDWHETKEEAIEQAEKMRAKAIAACERKLSKLKQLKF